MKSNLTILYKRYGPVIIRRCRKLLKDESLVKEAAQEVFICLLKNTKKSLKCNQFNHVVITTTNICIRKQKSDLLKK